MTAQAVLEKRQKKPFPEPLRLNLGGIGDDGSKVPNKIPGFLTVDIQDVPDTDVVTNIADLSMFLDASVSEIYASNCLEHFPHVETLGVLKEWRRVLKPRATLWISVPDMDANFTLYQKYGLLPWVQYLIWGDQTHPLAYHYINFTFATLADLINKAGFSDVKRVEKMPFGLADASEHRDSYHHIRVALNVQAVA